MPSAVAQSGCSNAAMLAFNCLQQPEREVFMARSWDMELEEEKNRGPKLCWFADLQREGRRWGEGRGGRREGEGREEGGGEGGRGRKMKGAH